MRWVHLEGTEYPASIVDESGTEVAHVFGDAELARRVAVAVSVTADIKTEIMISSPCGLGEVINTLAAESHAYRQIRMDLIHAAMDPDAWEGVREAIIGASEPPTIN